MAKLNVKDLYQALENAVAGMGLVQRNSIASKDHEAYARLQPIYELAQDELHEAQKELTNG